MRSVHMVISLMLITSIPYSVYLASALVLHNHKALQHSRFAGRKTSPAGQNGLGLTKVESINFPPAETSCMNLNGTQVSLGDGTRWTVICDIDFYSQDIYPFLSVNNFQDCAQACATFNDQAGVDICLAALFAPSRIDSANDCYLKSGVQNSIQNSVTHLIGVLLDTSASPTTSILPISMTTAVTSISTSSTTASAPQTQSSVDSSAANIPTILSTSYLGISTSKQTRQYIKHPFAFPQKLSAAQVKPGIDINLITSYPLASDTGTWTQDTAEVFTLSNMTIIPRLSRDGGRGGMINGSHVFIFCDTSTYGETHDPVLGYLNGFVASSVAVDEDMNALNNNALSLTNTLGQWQDDVGRMRGWAPMTTGEEAFNIAISGQGFRYAVWPNSSPVPLNSSHALMYAPLVYLQIDMHDQSSPRYTSLGNTLLLISIDPFFGPHADRLQNQFFSQDDINWGSLGGIRAWTSSGPSSQDTTGDVYLFGATNSGVLLAKTHATSFANKSSYSYWTGSVWSSNMIPRTASADTHVIDWPVMNIDLVYSPLHRTFILVYLTPEADNTFYYRQLTSETNDTLSILPPYIEGGDENYVEQLINPENRWSEEKVLFSVSAPARGYIYAGGLHAGYFGEDDITMGGGKMLCTWTEHTLVDPDVPESGYAHKSMVVELA